MDNSIRVHVFLASKGLGSRRECEKLIKLKLIRINGVFAKIGDKVKFKDRVEYKGRVFVYKNFFKKDNIYVALNKPKNYICSNFDPKGRPLAISLVNSLFKERVFSVGRLDFKSSGLLIFTNDGQFSNNLSYPGSKIEREYIIEASREINEDLLNKFKLGIKIKDEFFRLKSYVLLNKSSASLILTEGKNREIRKVFLSKNIFLKKVHRIRIGNIKLGNLSEGAVKVISKAQINKLKLIMEKRPCDNSN